jgi:nucleoside-triphosphatase THEP1
LKILLTGEIGAGKTTVCEKIVEGARRRGITCTGILTRNLKENGNVVLQIEELTNGEKRVLAQKMDDGKALRGIHYCKYVFD